MPRADQRLYAALLRLGRQFEAQRLPLLGVAGSELVCRDLSWRRTLRAAVEAPPPSWGLAEGARLLTLLQRQFETLQQAEEHTQEALAEWATLAAHTASWQGSHPSSLGSSSAGSSGGSNAPGAPAAPGLPFAAAAAAEEGLALLTRQARQLADPLFFLDAEEGGQEAEDSSSSSSSSGQEPAALSLDELAAAVRRQHPALFPAVGDSGSSSDSGSGSPLDTQLAQAAALGDVLYRQQRFKFEPFEWVYEGLSPLLLPPRLDRRKLAPLTLAVVAAGVARRLGLPLLPVPAGAGDSSIAAGVQEGPAGGAAGVAAGALPMDQLRPDVAQRYAGRAAAAAPAAEPWVLLLAPPAGGRGGGGGGGGCEQVQHQEQLQLRAQEWAGHVIDACTGQVLGAEAALQKFPDLQLSMNWQLLAPLVGWQHMVRTIIQAHQRRGESDLVAHWLYVLLALDPQAPEWGHMLTSNPLHTLGSATLG